MATERVEIEISATVDKLKKWFDEAEKITNAELKRLKSKEWFKLAVDLANLRII